MFDEEQSKKWGKSNLCQYDLPMANDAQISATEDPQGKSRTKTAGRGCLALLGLVLLLGLTPIAWRKFVQWHYGQSIYSVSEAPEERVALVFGAAVYRSGRLSPVLRDRMDTAVALYRSGKVQKLLVSGDNSAAHYNEPAAMQAYAIAQGVDPADILVDYAGFRTYDTCYRAGAVFDVNAAVLVTQAFHLPRAIFTCRQLGVEAVGVSADLRPYRGARWYALRETAATFVALLDVIRQEPPPTLANVIITD